MERGSHLSPTARDDWLLAAEALRAGLLEVAREHADRAAQQSRWDRYRLVMTMGAQVRECALLPHAWGYHSIRGWEEVLIVPPSASGYVADTIGLDFLTVMAGVRAQGPGLVRLDDALAAVLTGALETPDDAQALERFRDG